LGNPPLCNCSTVLQIRSFGTSKHTSAIREGQNGRSWSAAEQLLILFILILTAGPALGQGGSIPINLNTFHYVPDEIRYYETVNTW